MEFGFGVRASVGVVGVGVVSVGVVFDDGEGDVVWTRAGALPNPNPNSYPNPLSYLARTLSPWRGPWTL